ncbi:hypothetical protein [Ferrimonas marina]|uniref:Uncharacterized protein n=1 Tax=Ferrimonas marina TaxID=299255 RepID=A0A1M5TPJ9_9GAMM|nr:hypothetical protein [Ferrimonas marina]SHH52323.1 hypothetical protein SAMN02745129_2217 [Ferrimonas marina]
MDATQHPGAKRPAPKIRRWTYIGKQYRLQIVANDLRHLDPQVINAPGAGQLNLTVNKLPADAAPRTAFTKGEQLYRGTDPQAACALVFRHAPKGFNLACARLQQDPQAVVPLFIH